MFPMLKNRRGMTLLEIMIVLAIVASLIGVLATQINSRMKKAKINQAKIQIGEIGKALDMYYTDCNNYPTSADGLGALVTQPSSCSGWGPDPYLKRMPKDPWGNEFLYESQGNTFTLISLGSDKKEGGTGDASDISSQDL
jgi:general secretion pathway protein G